MPDESRPKSINQLFSVVSSPTCAEIHAFVVFCIERVLHLIEPENSKHAFQLFKTSDRVSPELAEQANIDSNSPSLQHSSAAKAVGYAVCHCTDADSFYFSDNHVENARLVAMYCQWAISRAECPPDLKDEMDSDDDDSGRSWLVQQIEDREQTAQLSFVFDRFPHWFGVSTDDA